MEGAYQPLYLSSVTFQYSQDSHCFHSGRILLMCSLKLYLGSLAFGSTGCFMRCMPASAGVMPLFFLLQRRQARTRFTQLETPPWQRGTTWSSVYSDVCRARPQYWHSPLSRT